jgi:hypothetical protein
MSIDVRTKMMFKLHRAPYAVKQNLSVYTFCSNINWCTVYVQYNVCLLVRVGLWVVCGEKWSRACTFFFVFKITIPAEPTVNVVIKVTVFNVLDLQNTVSLRTAHGRPTRPVLLYLMTDLLKTANLSIEERRIQVA